MEEFKELKTTFFAEVNSFKNQILTSHEILQSTSQNSETTEMIRLREDILFLKEQIRNKDKVIDSLLCQLSKRDDIFLLQNRGSTKTKTSALQTENTENVEKKSSGTMTSSIKRNENLLTERENENLLTTINNQIKKINNTKQRGNNNNKSTNEENSENEEKINNGDSGIDPKRVNKKVFIVGDSIVKHVKGYELTQSLENWKVHVKDFPGARVRCMQDYVQPTLRQYPDHIILHVGTNDLATNVPTDTVAESIVELAMSLKSDSTSVAISNITVRNDKHKNKVRQTNKHLKTLCMERNIELINHDSTITEKHLNGSRLHLNKRGTAILSNNFTEAISNSVF